MHDDEFVLCRLRTRRWRLSCACVHHRQYPMYRTKQYTSARILLLASKENPVVLSSTHLWFLRQIGSPPPSPAMATVPSPPPPPFLPVSRSVEPSSLPPCLAGRGGGGGGGGEERRGEPSPPFVVHSSKAENGRGGKGERPRYLGSISLPRVKKGGGMVKEGFVKGCSAVREFSCSESICRGSWQIQILTNSLQSLQPSEEAETNISW